MELNLKIQLDITPAFENCLRALLDSSAWGVKASRLNNPEAVSIEAPAVSDPAETPVQVADESSAASDDAPTPSEEMYSDAYLRAAMDKTRARIIGEDWNTDKTTDRYKRYFSALNARFRAIANAIAIENDVQASKPTELPKTAVRERFVRECDELELDDNGEIAVKTPF